jgi:hypothetical protein
VHDHVEAAEKLDRACDRRSDRRRVGDVASATLGRAARGADRLDGLGEALLVHVDGEHPRPLGGEGPRRGGAQPRGGAGDRDGTVREACL